MPDDIMPEEPSLLRKELDRNRLVVSELQKRIRELEEDLNAAATMAEVPAIVVTKPELRQTLSRLMNKVAMIVQAEKVVIFIHQAEAGELSVLPPALGVTEEQAAELRISVDAGISGRVFRSGESVIFNDALNHPDTLKDKVSLLRVRNGICVPLKIKQRDDEERVVDERIIGVMHVFNKRYDQEFNDDDMRLLEMLADQAAAVIANAQVFIELAEEKERLADTFESIHAGVIVVSAVGRLRLINKAAHAMLHIAPESYIGRSIEEVIPDQEIVAILRETVKQQTELTKEIGVEADHRIYKAETTLMQDDAGGIQHAVAIFNDITELRQVERMKTAFVSTVSHELRTPLTSIKGFIATLMDDTDGLYDDETRHEFYDIINQECDRLTRLINDLLNVSRIESGRAIDMNITDMNISEVVNRVLTAQQTYTDRHKLVNKLVEGFPTIEADEDKVQQIIDNLVGNAIKYSPNGGEVSVSAEEEATTVRIDIEDQGLGVPERHRDKIFQRFHMVDDDVNHRAVKGTGIGLFLVKHLAQAHHGDVWLAWSEVGKGSRFSIRLPKTHEKAE